jgi:hypothetical protein
MCPKDALATQIWETPKQSDKLDFTGNPCSVDEEVLDSKFGRHTCCPVVASGLPPFLRTNSGAVSQTVCDRFLPHVSQSHYLVITLKFSAVQLLPKRLHQLYTVNSVTKPVLDN